MASTMRFGPLARAVLRTQTDDRLVALVRDGTEAAFEEIVRRYRAPLVAFAAAFGPPDPEGVVQDSLARAWEALRETNTEMNLKPWLYTIVRNRAHNARRDERPSQQLPEGLDGVRQPPEIVLERDELARAVAAVSALPEAQRQALVRSALEGHTHEQIATAVGATPGSVRQLIYRARIAVRHGVGALIPLPLVAALAQAGGGTGAIAGATGAGATGGALGGATMVGKVIAVAAVGAVAAGSGVAIERAVDSDPRASEQRAVNPRTEPRREPTVEASSSSAPARAIPGGPAASASQDAAGSSGPGPAGGGSGRGSGGPVSSSGSGPSAGGGSSTDGSGSPGGSGSSGGSGGSGGASGQGPRGPSGGDDSGTDGTGGSSGPGGGDHFGEDPAIETEHHSGPGGGDGDEFEPPEATTTTTAPTTTTTSEDHSGPGGGDGRSDDGAVD